MSGEYVEPPGGWCSFHFSGCEDDENCTAFAAEKYAARGWRVLPIKPGDKRPPMKGWQNAATTDGATISQWFGKDYPGYGVGVATGESSGVFVLDVDTSDGKTGDETLHELEQKYGPLPQTAHVITGSGGSHYYFRFPEGVEIRNSASAVLGAGLDIRGEGGQVVAPPTMHPCGTRYQWEGGEPGEVADAPAWLVEMLTAEPEPVERREPVTATTQDGARLALVSPLNDSPAERYNASTTWAELLGGDGWELETTDRDGTQNWRRPGKNRGEGTSGTVRDHGEGPLTVFTTSIPWLRSKGKAGDGVGSYSRFQYMAARDHQGDASAAAIAFLKSQPRDAQHSAPSGDDSPAEVAPWEQPVPLTGTDAAPPFPTEVFPEPLREFVETTAAGMGTEPDLMAALMLSVLSAAVGGRGRVRVRSSWYEQLTLHVVAIGAPGTMKSPAMSNALAPIDAIERDLIEKHAANVAHAESERRIKEGRLKKLEATASASDLGEDREAALKLSDELAGTTVPVVPAMYATDSTPERLEQLLAEHGGRFAWLDPEGGLFTMAAGRYSSKGANLDVFLKGHNGDPIKVERMGRPPVVVNSPSLTIGLAVQPSVIIAAGANPEFAGRGLLARQLFAWPDLEIVNRSRAVPDVPEYLAEAYASRIVSIYEAAEAIGAGEKRTLSVDPDALEALNTWFAQTWNMRQPGGELADVPNWADKLDGQTVRLAGLLAWAANPRAESVNLAAATRGITLARYFIPHALRTFGEIGLREDLRGAAHCLTAILKARPKGGTWADWPAMVTTRDVQRGLGKKGPQTAEEVRASLAILEGHGYLRSVPDTKEGRGRKTDRYEVNPYALPRATPVAPAVALVAGDSVEYEPI